MSNAGIERRRWPRISASALGNISAAIMAGPNVVNMVDLSCGGALLEVAARFPLKSSVRLKLTRAGGEPIVVEGRVARAKVAALVNGVINYRVAVIFERPIAGLVPAATDAQPQEQQSETAPCSSVTSIVSGDGAAPPAVSAGTPADADASGDVTVAAADAARAAGERTLTIVPARAATAAGPSESDDAPLALRSELASERSSLEKELAAATAGAARQASVNRSLAARLAESDERRTALHAELEAERRQWEEDRSTFLQQISDAVAVADALQASLDAREQAHAQAVAEQRDEYDALIAQLVKSTNDQQTEYQHLVEELTAAADEQRRRAEHHEAEIARQRVAVQQDRADAEARRHALEARLQAAEALCAAHEARHQALRRQVEKLASMVTAPLSPRASHPHEAAFACETEVERTRAIA